MTNEVKQALLRLESANRSARAGITAAYASGLYNSVMHDEKLNELRQFEREVETIRKALEAQADPMLSQLVDTLLDWGLKGQENVMAGKTIPNLEEAAKRIKAGLVAQAQDVDVIECLDALGYLTKDGTYNEEGLAAIRTVKRGLLRGVK